MTLSQVVDGVTDLDSALFNPIITEVNSLRTSVDRADDALAPVFSPLSYSGVGDGVTDDLTPLQAAVDAAVAVNGIVDIGANDWYISDTLTADGDFALVGTGRILYPIGCVALSYEPAWGTAISVSGFTDEVYPAGIGTYCAKLTVSDSSGFSAGDIALVYSTDNLVSDSTGKRGELMVVAGVATGFVYLHGTLSDTYTTSPKIRKHPMGRIEIDGPTFSASSDPTVSTGGRGRAALEVNGASSGFIRATFRDTWSRGLFLIGCHGVSADVVAQRCRDDVNHAAYGYGVSIGPGCRFCSVRVIGTRCRHAVTSNVYTALTDGWYGEPRSCHIHDSLAIACTSSGFDNHAGCYEFTYENCHNRFTNEGDASTSGQHFGFQNRGHNTSYLNCTNVGIPGFLYDASGGTNYGGRKSTTRLVGCSDRASATEYAVITNLQMISASSGSYLSDCEILAQDILCENKRLMSEIPLKLTVDGGQVINCSTMRIAAGKELVLRNVRREWRLAGTQEPILLRAGSVLTVDGYTTKGTHSPNSMIRGVSGAGTWTVYGKNVGSEDTATFKTDDTTGTWDVNDISVAVA